MSSRANRSQSGTRVCIVVPSHSAQLADSERFSLKQLLAVLGAYPLFFAAPQSLPDACLLDRAPGARIVRFADQHFASVASYNRLLLSDAFYARFEAYDYMLIHQLDAFVFRDELADWCRRGYDYIGAPWLRAAPPPGRFKRGALRVRSRLYRWLDIRRRSTRGLHSAQYAYRVGNGGLSLRRIASMRQSIAELAARVQPYREYREHTRGEDMFFSIEANRYRRRLRIPGYAEAAHFSWEHAPTLAQQLTGGPLPFGCHGWNKLHPEFWTPVFARLGYTLA
ncbi:MAG: hypothetical protein NVS9B10_12340 [Nevskia sp.]